MKFHGCVTSIVLLLTFVSGCAMPISMGPSGVSPGGLMSDVNYPSLHEAQTRISFKREDIEILGVVEAEAESRNFLWIWAGGDNGYGNLMRAARQAYPQADGVVDVQLDSEYFDLLQGCGPVLFCLPPIPLTATVTTHFQAKAFRFKR